MAATADLELARAAFARQAWREAYDGLAQLTPESLDLDDIEKLATAAALIGREAESRAALAHGHRAAEGSGEIARAARFAFWLGHELLFSAESSQAGGWFARARKLLIEHDLECVESGYLIIPEAIERLFGGDPSGACVDLMAAAAIGVRYSDRDLQALAGHGHGRALLKLGRCAEAMQVLDEVMVAVSSGEVHPMAVGGLYCGVLAACREAFDVRRAREWTAALGRWCDAQPDLVPYRGPCLVHRAEVMQLRGDWDAAVSEARQACEWLALPTTPEGAGDAYYVLGELHRLRGQLAEAEDAYRQASRLGRRPEPGLPLLWLARGDVGAARTAIRRALDETPFDLATRFELLDACLQVALAAGDAERARSAAEEMAEIALKLEAPLLNAGAARAAASVLLAEGDASGALAPLRRAWTEYQRLDAPYDAARVRLLVGRAYRGLGDEESALMELDAARWVFERLGAAPEIERIDALTRAQVTTTPAYGLTPRELDVLRLLAHGRTNKEIAAALVISEHTVARHVQNMLGKLDCRSRASLAVFAVERGLVPQRDGQS